MIFKTENSESCYNLESAHSTIGTIQAIETFHKFSLAFFAYAKNVESSFA